MNLELKTYFWTEIIKNKCPDNKDLFIFKLFPKKEITKKGNVKFLFYISLF